MGEITQYVKGIAVIVGSILTAVAAVIPEVPLWLKIAIAVATAVSVIALPNSLTNKQSEQVAKHLVEAGLIDPASPIPFGDSGFRNQ